MKENADRIIVDLDCTGERARELAAILQGRARWLKVGMTLFYQEGPSIVQELKELGFKVFLDLKLHDIPHQVEGAAAAVVATGADMFTVHASGGLAMMEAAASSAGDAISLGVTVLTSMDQESLQDLGVHRFLPEQVSHLASLVKQAGLTGVVCSPHEAADMRRLLGPEAAIVTPGVRLPDDDKGDQSRVMTPAAALSSGASHLVIGRPITAADDPAAAFDRILASLGEVE